MIMQIAIIQPSSASMPEAGAAAPAVQPTRAIATGAIGYGRSRIPPTALLMLAIIFVQLGGALATVLFSSIGAIGTAFISTFFSAAVVTLLASVDIIPMGGIGFHAAIPVAWRHRWLVLLFGFTNALLTLAYYLALETLPLGVVATITFLGPLGLAVATSRRPVHFLWIGIAALGIVLLTPEVGAALDPLGLFYATMAAFAWAGFVPLSKRIGTALPGQAGLAFALWVGAAILLPLAVVARKLFDAGPGDIGAARRCTADNTGIRRAAEDFSPNLRHPDDIGTRRRCGGRHGVPWPGRGSAYVDRRRLRHAGRDRRNAHRSFRWQIAQLYFSRPDGTGRGRANPRVILSREPSIFGWDRHTARD
jgi:inner membrane transporter RhtA